MRNIYITVALLFIGSVVLFIGSFVYLDMYKHRVYYYTIRLDGHNVGNIKIDRFVTDDKLIYKSAADIPFNAIFTRTSSRLVLDRKYNLESYSRERYAGDVAETVYLENKKNGVSFLGKLESSFACLDAIPIKKGTFIFEEDSPVTYLPVIENYDFKKGRSQGFYGFSSLGIWNLPPMKRFVTLTSIKDEFLKIERKRIKTENLILKIKNYPQGSVWVAKSDRSLVKLQIPQIALEIVRTFSPKELKAEPYVLEREKYTSSDVTFKNRNIQLSGTLTIPKEDGPFPAVVLAGNEWPQNRDHQGLFLSLANHLSSNGFAVLRFDRRGIGASEGSATSATDSDKAEDLDAAITYVSAQDRIDPQKIAVIAHSKAAGYTIKTVNGKDAVKALILMAPSILSDEMSGIEVFDNIAKKAKWTEDYSNTVRKCLNETRNKVASSGHNWTFVLGKICYVKAMKDRMSDSVMSSVNKVAIPTLIIYDKEDEYVPESHAIAINNAIGMGGNKDHSLSYYDYLGHLFGNRVNDGKRKIHYETDNTVMKDILAWLKTTLTQVPKPSATPPEEPKKIL